MTLKYNASSGARQSSRDIQGRLSCEIEGESVRNDLPLASLDAVRRPGATSNLAADLW